MVPAGQKLWKQEMWLRGAVQPSPKWHQHFWLSSRGTSESMHSVAPYKRVTSQCLWFGQSYRLVFSWGQVLSLRGCLEMSENNFGCLDPKTVRKERQGKGWGVIDVQWAQAMMPGNLLQWKAQLSTTKDYLAPKLKVWKLRNFSQIQSQNITVRIMITIFPTTLEG